MAPNQRESKYFLASNDPTPHNPAIKEHKDIENRHHLIMRNTIKKTRRLRFEPLEDRRLLALMATGDTIFDDVSGLEWLPTNRTVNRSYDDVIASLGAGEEFDGWSYGTRQQIRDLFKSGGVTQIPTTGGSTTDATAVQAIHSLFGTNVYYSSIGLTSILSLNAESDPVLANAQLLTEIGLFNDGTTYVVDSGNVFRNQRLPTVGSWLYRPAQSTDLIAKTLTIDNGSVNFTYELAGAPLPADTTVNLYWSDDPSFDAGDSPALTENVASGTVPDTYSVNKKVNDLQGTKKDYLILVADPPANPSDPNDNGLIDESNENNNEKAIEALTDITVTDATTTDFRKIEVKYTIANFDAPAFIFRAYASADDKFDPATSGGTDLPIRQVGISDASKRATNSDGSPNEHKFTFDLKQPKLPSLDTKFLLVVADPDKGVREADEANNEMFVIPVFLEKKGKSGGGFNDNGNFEWKPTGRDSDFVDEVVHRIFGESDAYNLNLTTPDVTRAIWESVGGFKNEEFEIQENLSYFPAFRDDDARINRGLSAPLTELVRLITTARNQGRLNSNIRITEAFDQNGEHQTRPKSSAHYEGRGVDFGTDQEGRKLLTGLALLAGFQRFDNELDKHGNSTLHVHVAHNGAVSPVSLESLNDNVEFGKKVNIIGQDVYTELRASLDGAIQVKGSRPLTGLSKAELKALEKWIKAIEKTAAKHAVSAPRQLIANPNEITQGMGRGIKSPKPGGLEFNTKAYLNQIQAARKQFPLMAAPLDVSSTTEATPLTIDPASGQASEFLGRLRLQDFGLAITDLPEDQLGEASDGVITLDINANGAGWFIDDTPSDNSEFTQLDDGSLVASPESPAYGRYDLLTVVLHELGHLKGHDHTNNGLMAATLPLGTRRLPDEGTLDFSPDPRHNEELAAAPFVGTIDSAYGLPIPPAQPEFADYEIVADPELPLLPVPYETEPTSYELLYDDRRQVEADEYDELFGDSDEHWYLFDPRDWLKQF